MRILKSVINTLFVVCMGLALWQCAKRGSPTGGPKDETPPVLVRAEPEQMTTNFEGDEIRLYFDEYVKLQNVQEQLIVSPPLKYPLQITPQGSASKYVKIVIEDTLRPNTTYTFNFGQSIVDNNENNPAPFVTYVMSTGDYIDSLKLEGAVTDAFKQEAESFISVMLYELDSAYTDSTVFQEPPTYITNTLDSATTFQLRNLKEGEYALFALKDVGKNNVFDQDTDKIGFITDTISLPTDSSYTLRLFREIPDYAPQPPSFAANNKIIFGYRGAEAKDLQINPITPIPDTTRTLVTKMPGKDSLLYWFTPLELDSIVFELQNKGLGVRDTFVVKPRNLPADSLVVSGEPGGLLEFDKEVLIKVTTPIAQIDSSNLKVFQQDTIPVAYATALDSTENAARILFDKEPNNTYRIEALPGVVTDFFGNQNDSLIFTLNTGSYADFGNLRVVLEGEVDFPVIVQLTETNETLVREIFSDSTRVFEFNNLLPRSYVLRLIVDENANRRWDTGNYLQGQQPEKVHYYSREIEVRANWELVETFSIE